MAKKLFSSNQKAPQDGLALDADKSALNTLASLWPYIWPSDRPDLKRRVAFALIALLFGKLANVLTPFFFKWATDALTDPAAPDGIGVTAWLSVPVMLVFAYGVARISNVGFEQLRDALFARVGQHAVRKISSETFRHMHDLSLRYHLQRRTGTLSRIIERGTRGIESVVRHTILNAFPTFLQFLLMAVVIAYQFDFVYLVIVVGLVVAFVLFSTKVSSMRINIRREMNESDNEAHAKAVDSLLNFETVKYFCNEGREAERFDGAMERYNQSAIRTWVSLAWLNFGQITIFSIGMALCMALSAKGILDGTQSVGDFVLINAMLMQLFIPLNLFGFMHREIKQGLVDLEAMFSLLRQKPEVVDPENAKKLDVQGGNVRFEDVLFHYDAARPILKGISFDVPAGKTVAIVGPSGAGKSTISRLLFRFYNVTGGRILIDGQDLCQVQQHSVREKIGIVPQDTVLFNESLLYNIGYGRLDASQAEIEEAARMAQVADFIKTLPDGFDTEVGERGLKLSGGEKQRVAIARTILKAPPILVLDEATSALDTHTEQEIQSALHEVSQNRTTLIIAHRLSTVIHADEILVLDAGRIVERGSHADLLEQEGLYASMWDRQRQANEAEEQLHKVRLANQEGPKAY